MVQSGGTAKPAASSRNIPLGQVRGDGQKAEVVTRIKNAKELRRAYVELNQAPDGADPDPLTIPKCVECSHCGWPVYPRDSKIATKKTFARAGIQRGNKSEEDAKRKAEMAEKAAKGEQEEDAGSADSRDTVERMADEIEDLKDAKEELTKKNEELEADNDRLNKELQDTKDALAAAEERIEFLEEAEKIWREKLSKARLEIERLNVVLNRAGMVAADRECGLVKTILELRELREKHEAFVRRRDFMLKELENRYEEKDKEDAKGIVLRMWRTSASTSKLKRKFEDLEMRRQQEVRTLSEQLEVEREQIQNLRVQKERLVARLKEAGQRLLRRSLGCDHFPSALDHVFRAFVAMHPVNSLENALEFCQQELEKVNNQFSELTDKYDKLEEERDMLLRSGDAVVHKLKATEAELAKVKEERDQALAEVERLKTELQATKDAAEEARKMFEEIIRDLEERLAAAEAAAMANNKQPEKPVEDPNRLGKGTGVVCVSCLKQLVHRGVQPLPPVDALEVTAEKLDKARKEYFEKELCGAANPNDQLHEYTFNARKDPYGLAKLSLAPLGGAITKPMSPTTGLPSLRKNRFGGSATALRASMKEFQPRSFR